jgi:hemolysin III
VDDPGNTSDAVVTKPLLRGVLHTYAAAAAVGAGLVLLSYAPTTRAAIAVAVFVASLVVLFTVSAIYHRVHWGPLGRKRMRRADHASIFVLIAGTYTPIALLGLPPATGNRLLLMIWVGALVGVLVSLFWIQAPKVLVAILAVAVGWTMVPYMGDVRRAYGDLLLGLILAGGVAYSLGAIAYAAKRPVLWPELFGYHELFHALTLLGATLHFIVVRAIMGAGCP